MPLSVVVIDRHEALALNNDLGPAQTFKLLDFAPTSLNLAGCIFVAQKESIVRHTGRDAEPGLFTEVGP